MIKLKSIIPFYILLLLCTQHLYSQKNEIQKSIYYKSTEYTLDSINKMILNQIIDSLSNFEKFEIHLNGFTDNIGESMNNKQLSQNRVNEVMQYFIEKGILHTLITTQVYGEEKPVGDNSTEEGKQLNRRVDICITYTRKTPIDSTQFLPNINELYRLIEKRPDEYCINPLRDTVIYCQQGTIIFIKANSFKLSNSDQTSCVTVLIKEVFKKSDMILENLSTLSNGKILESDGMLYIEAFDNKGSKLEVANKNSIIVFSPTVKKLNDAKIFQGKFHNKNINWKEDEKSKISNFPLLELNLCNNFGNLITCPFFFCKIRLFFEKIFKKQKKQPVKTQSKKDMKAVCKYLDDLYKKYGVDNVDDLKLALNKPLFDKYNVKTVKELKDTLRKIEAHTIELAFQNKTIKYSQLEYYVYNFNSLGWRNVDCFSNMPVEQLAHVNTNLAKTKNVNCNIVFKSQRIIVPSFDNSTNFKFKNIPKNEMVWIVAIKYQDNQPFLCIKEITVDNQKIDIIFEKVTLEELKQKLKQLDS